MAMRQLGMEQAILHAGISVLVLLATLLVATVSFAGEADVEDVRIVRQADGRYRFDVTVRHADAGWEHYADAWQVLDEAGNVLGERVLLHPHDDEQPFTRSLSDVAIPAGVSRVTIRARDTVHGFGGREVTVELPGS